MLCVLRWKFFSAREIYALAMWNATLKHSTTHAGICGIPLIQFLYLSARFGMDPMWILNPPKWNKWSAMTQKTYCHFSFNYFYVIWDTVAVHCVLVAGAQSATPEGMSFHCQKSEPKLGIACQSTLSMTITELLVDTVTCVKCDMSWVVTPVSVTLTWKAILSDGLWEHIFARSRPRLQH